jgi:uncharacterized MnhB-related membrane protein
LSDILKGLIDLAHVIQEHGKRSPEDSLWGELLCSLAQTLECFLRLIKTNHASAFNVKRVHILVFATLLSFTNVLESTIDVAVTEAAPGQMLVHSHVLIIQGEGSLKGSLGLLEILFLLIE